MTPDVTFFLPAVRKCLGDPRATIGDLNIGPLGGGFSEYSGGLGTFSVSGMARTATGPQSFRMVLKSLGNSGQGGDDPAQWNYWKREALAYATGVVEGLPQGLAAPACYGVAAEGADKLHIFLENVEDCCTQWGMNEYKLAAHRLGQFNGAYLAGVVTPVEPWMLAGRTKNWPDLAAAQLAALPGDMTDRVRGVWMGGNRMSRTLALFDQRHRLQAGLSRLPRCLCHHDAHRRNLMFCKKPGTTGIGEELLLTGIDWSMIGPGAVGEDLAILIGVTLQFGDWPFADARPFAGALLDSYHAGLVSAGSRISIAEVRLGYCATVALVLAVGAVGVWETDLGGPQTYEILEGLLGAPIDGIVMRFASLQDYFLDLGEQALSQMR